MLSEEVSLVLKKPHPNAFRERVSQYPGRIFSEPERPEERELLLQLFERSGKNFVELGSGSGKHLIARGATEPTAKFFGFEIRYKRCVRTIEKADTRGVENVYIIRRPAMSLETLAPNDSLDGMWVNFPDPWQKPTRQKHRILNSRSVPLVRGKLKTGGFLSFKTDHPELFESTLSIVSSTEGFVISETSRDLHSSPEFLQRNIMTEFESLFCSQGLPIHYFQAVKTI